jgi:hypothetical protein
MVAEMKRMMIAFLKRPAPNFSVPFLGKARETNKIGIGAKQKAAK